MNIITLYSGTATRTFKYDDLEIEYNDQHGGVSKITLFKAGESGGGDANLERVEIGCSNTALSEIESITEYRMAQGGLQGKLVTKTYKSFSLQRKRFYLYQDEMDLRTFIKSAAMPLTKSKKAKVEEVVKSVKQVGVNTQEITKAHTKKSLADFVKENKPQTAQQKKDKELFKSVKSNILANNNKGVEAELTKTGKLKIDKEEVELCKAADLQLLSVIDKIKKCVGGLEALSPLQQIDLANFIKSLNGVECAKTIQKATQQFLASLNIK
ncbi:hypothetical protein NB520_03590 [Vibrio antiquarius]|uniref:hypothetical protein n=1 Tax=Vibrio antiquarius (strain Ex25) TaxID=150340 RepID=UPI00265B4071|nr:hypothetical protein [Vibrio antiquarius]MCR9626925.1 hypothetical protein [Vibrio antiquarius]MCR9630574.1 hypothetical protein [Vibrio antiquarius]